MPFDPPEPTRQERGSLAERAGLCALCAHLQVLRSKTSVFVRCGRSDESLELPRYPVLPMLRCPGFEAARADAEMSPAAAPTRHSG